MQNDENGHVSRAELRKLGLRKIGYKSLTQRAVALLAVLRENGPLTYSELCKKTSIPRGSLERLRDHLLQRARNYASSYSFYLATIFLVVNASLVATIKSKKPDSDNTATTIIERIREKVKRRKPANHGDL
jgi:hypothetical protein